MDDAGVRSGVLATAAKCALWMTLPNAQVTRVLTATVPGAD
jgi:hypothetical protein